MEITVPMAAYVTSVAALTTAMALLIYRRANPEVPGLSLWTLAAVCQSAGIAFVALRDPLPLWVSSVLGVGLSGLGSVLVYCGIRVYAGRAELLRLALVPLVILVGANLAMLTVAPSMPGRVIAISVFFATFGLCSLIQLLRTRPYGSRLPRDALILLFTLSVAINLTRATALALADDQQALIAGDAFQAGFFLWGAFQVVARDLMLVALASQYTADRQRAAVEEARTLSRAIEASPLSCVITDAAGTIEYVNDRFCGLTGYRRGEALGRRPSLLKSGRQPAETYDHMWATIGRGDIWKGEIINRRKDGSEFTAVLAIAPMRNAAGGITRYVGIHEDISGRKEMERRMAAAQQAAERANQAKSDFLTSMSHELRTPLNAILGFSQLMQMTPGEPLTARQDDNVRQVIKAGEHLLTLINDILDLARIEAGHVDLTITTVPIRGLIGECLPLVHPLAERAGVTVAAEPGDDSLALTADALRVKQVLINLLSNAVKYNRRGGQVRLSWACDPGGQVRVVVSDNGMGIPEAKQAAVFTPFGRAVEPNSTIEGTGMGLVVSRQLVEAMGGTLDFTSCEGVGSTFWLVLPQAGAAMNPSNRLCDLSPSTLPC